VNIRDLVLNIFLPISASVRYIMFIQMQESFLLRTQTRRVSTRVYRGGEDLPPTW
jgi:hypothetical protein